jgi:outer membrane protease
VKHLRSTVWAGAAVLASASSALAADQVTQEVFASPDANFVMVGGIGYTWLKSNELVYEDDGRRLSQPYGKPMLRF